MIFSPPRCGVKMKGCNFLIQSNKALLLSPDRHPAHRGQRLRGCFQESTNRLAVKLLALGPFHGETLGPNFHNCSQP